MKLSLSTLLFPEKPVEGAVEEAAKLGFPAVEIIYDMPHFSPELDEKRLKGLHDLIVSLGLDATVHSSFWDLNPMSHHPAVRELSIAQAKNSILACDILEAGMVTVHPGRCTYWMREDTFSQARDWYREYMLECWGYARELGVKLAVETGMGAADYPRTVNQIVELAGYFEGLGVTIDVAHMFISAHEAGSRDPEGDIVGAIDNIGDKLYDVHLHDNHGVTDEHLVPGKGSVDFERVLEALKAAGYDGPLVLELWNPEKPVETGKEGLEVVKKAIGD